MNHFWIDIYSTEMLLANFTNVLGHILGKNSTDRNSLHYCLFFFQNFSDEQSKNISHMPVQENSASWQISKTTCNILSVAYFVIIASS